MRISDWSSDVCSSDLDAPELILIELRGEVAELAQDIQQLREALPGAPVVVLTDESDPGTLAACLHAGAAAFLLKDIHMAAPINSLTVAMLGQQVMPTERGTVLLYGTTGVTPAEGRRKEAAGRE